MRRLLFLFILLPGLSFSCMPGKAQNPKHEKEIRFKPYAGLTYNFHTMNNPLSHFPGIEFGFVLDPKKEKGWLLEYRNTFLGELAIYGIADQTSNPYNGFLTDIVDRTIGNGFLGRFDLGKTLIGTEERKLHAGFSISDKVVLGTDVYPLMTYSAGDDDTYTNSGFHFTPGVFASYAGNFKNLSVLSINISLCQSLFNLHQFGADNSIDHFVLPLFTELQITYQVPMGIYLRMGGLYAASIKGVPADARFNTAIGYTFRLN